MTTRRGGKWLVEGSDFAILGARNVEADAVALARKLAAKRGGLVYISVRGHGSTAFTVKPDGTVTRGLAS